MGKKLLACVVLVAVAVVMLVVQMLAGESGEVVVLHTFGSADAGGTAQETRLWVVDHDGSQYLRAGAQMSGWYQSLLANPAVEVQREGVSHTYTAVPAVGQRARINDLMQAKYGWRESYIGTTLGGRDTAMPIRLDPR